MTSIVSQWPESTGSKYFAAPIASGLFLWIVIGSCLGICTASVFGDAMKVERVEAQKIVVMDPTGKYAATMGVDKTGGFRVRISEPTGQYVELGLEGALCGVLSGRPDNEQGFVFIQNQHTSGFVLLKDVSGDLLVSLESRGNDAKLKCRDAKHVRQCAIGIDQDIAFADVTHKERGKVGMSAKGDFMAALLVRDRLNKIRVGLYGSTRKSGLEMQDDQERQRLVLKQANREAATACRA